MNGSTGYIKSSLIQKNNDILNMHKVIMPKAFGTGNGLVDKMKPLYAGPGDCCTDTYLVMGAFNTKLETDNYISYISTKFFHFLTTLRKNTHLCSRAIFNYIPQQDFTKSWTDSELFEKYGITNDEIAFIMSMVR